MRLRQIVSRWKCVTAIAVIAVLLVLAANASIGSPTPQADGATRVVNNGELVTAKPHLREPRAPLSAQEISYAIHLAIKATGSSARAQILSIDLPPATQTLTSDRLAVVTLFDYEVDKTMTATVNLSRGSHSKVTSSGKIHLPPNLDEAKRAMQIAITAPNTPAFVEEFQRTNGIPLLKPEQVWYRAGAIHDDLGLSAPPCSNHRCVHLIVQDLSGRYFETRDFVVDLSDQTVINLTEVDDR